MNAPTDASRGAPRPTVIVLDLGGVVVRICRSWKEGCAAAGVPCPPAAEGDAPQLHTALARLIDAYQRGGVAHEAFLADVATAFAGAHTPQEIDRVHRAWILGDYPGVRELLDAVRAMGIRVACLSNTNAVHWQQMLESSAAFNAIEIRQASHLLGMNKPHEGIFGACEGAVGCAGGEILFFDDLEENIAAARARGWDAVRIDPAQCTAGQMERALRERGVEVQRAPAAAPARCEATHDAAAVPARALSAASMRAPTLLGTTAPGGRIKDRPEDFLVDELPLYEPSGEGEHIFVCVQKRNLAHEDLVRIVARHYGVAARDVGFAGRKDRSAITRQVLSVNIPGPEPASALVHDGVEVLWSARHRHKLRLGQLAGNRFVIRVRGVDPLQVPLVHRRLQQLVRSGVPNAFGPQRFGMRLDGAQLGAWCILEQWDLIAQHLTTLGDGTFPFPLHQRAAREACSQGRFEDSLALWGDGDRSERRVSAALALGTKPARAVKELGGDRLRFWVSAWQSAVFNRVLAARLAERTWDQPMVGDVLQVGDSSRCFMLGADEDIAQVRGRCEAFEVSPTGPLPGTSGRTPTGIPGTIEEEAMSALGIPPVRLAKARHAPAGARRALRAQVRAASVESGVDEHGGYILLRFELPPGSFATTVLGELLGPVANA